MVYHPEGDLDNTNEEVCELVSGGRIFVSYLKDAFQLKVVKRCNLNGRSPVGIAFDASTGDS